MDKCTFGDSKAAMNLISILSEPEYEQYSSAVAGLIGRCQQEMRGIMGLPNIDLRVTILVIWKHRFVDLVKARNFPEKIETHVCNVIATSCKKLLRETNPRVYKSTHYQENS